MRTLAESIVDRRVFLAASLAGAAALALPRGAFARSGRASGLPWREIAPDTRILVDERIGGNVLLFRSGAHTLVVDTQFPSTAGAIRADAEEVARSLIVVNTHHHADHTGGNMAFRPDFPVYAHTACAPRVEAQVDRYRAAAEGAVRQAAELDFGTEVFNAAGGLQAQAQEINAARVVPNKLVGSPQNAVTVGQTEVELHHFGPGHTDNDLVVRLPAQNLVHTGDLVFSNRHPFIDRAAGATISGWLGSLWRVHALCNARTTVVPGHGPMGDRSIVRAMIDYLEQLHDAVAADIDAGVTRDEAIEKTYPFMRGVEFERLRARAIGSAYEEVSERR